MKLESVPDMERELERCKLNLKRLQQVLAEEKFKVWYLQAALAGEKMDPPGGRREGGDGGGCGSDTGSRGASVKEQEPAGPVRAPPPPRHKEGAAGRDPDSPGPAHPDSEVATPAEPSPYVCLDLPAWPGAVEGGGAVRSLTAAIHQQLVQPRLLFRLREDCAPPSLDGTGSTVPGEERPSETQAGRSSEEGEPDASGGDDGGDCSDHDFEMVDLNEKFVLGHLLMAPYRFGTRDEAEKPARPCSPHRWMHLISGGWRHHRRRSRDLEQLEAEDESPRRGAREHLAQWGRKRFLRVPDRDSPSHSSPERGSDCSHNSSDHEDGFSVGKRTPILGTWLIHPAGCWYPATECLGGPFNPRQLGSLFPLSVKPSVEHKTRARARSDFGGSGEFMKMNMMAVPGVAGGGEVGEKCGGMADLPRPWQDLSSWPSALTPHRSSRVFCTTLIVLCRSSRSPPFSLRFF